MNVRNFLVPAGRLLCRLELNLETEKTPHSDCSLVLLTLKLFGQFEFNNFYYLLNLRPC